MWPLNTGDYLIYRGDHMGRFDCVIKFVSNLQKVEGGVKHS